MEKCYNLYTYSITRCHKISYKVQACGLIELTFLYIFPDNGATFCLFSIFPQRSQKKQEKYSMSRMYIPNVISYCIIHVFNVYFPHFSLGIDFLSLKKLNFVY